jgi:hypothetical protein
MAAWTLAQAQAKLAEWLNAESKLALGQSVAVDGQSVTYARTREYIDFWRKECEALQDSSGANPQPFSVGLVNFL